MIRVLHAIDSLDLGGAQTALLNLLTPCDRREFHHEVASMHGRGMFADAFESVGIPVHSLSSRRWPPEYLWKFPGVLRKGGFDVVHCHLFGANWIAKPLAFFSGCRCIYNHDQCNDAFRRDSRVVTRVDAVMNQFSTRILCVSHSITRFLSVVESVPADKLIYLPNSVDLNVFHPASVQERRLARERFDLPQDAIVIGGVGRLTAQKQFSVFVEMASLLLQRHPDWVFVLFGSGPDDVALRKQAESLGDSLRFMGSTEHRASIYHALDVQVLTSKFEGLPMTMLEGMASGVPVVASRVDGVMEIAKHGEHGLLVDPGLVGGFAEAVQDVLSQPALRDHLIAAARAMVCADFDARVLSRRLHALYKQDVENPGASVLSV